MANRDIRHWAGWIGLAFACAGFAVLNTLGWYPAYHLPGAYGPGWKQAILWELVRWELWVPLTAVILRLVRTFSARRGGAVREVLRYISAGLLFPAAHSILVVAIYFPVTGGRLGAFLHYRLFVVLTDYLAGIIVTGLILGIARARDFQLQLRSEEVRASHLEAQLAQAQLQALKMQLHPHFLFNTLNAISSLQLDHPEAAQRMLVRLAEFLRLTLEAPSDQVTVRREMDFAARYLEIERVRFQEKLSVRFDVAPETLDALVPNLILQPMVENAVRHGIAVKAGPGKIQICSTRNNGFLRLEVRDTGPGLANRAAEYGASSEALGGKANGSSAEIGLANIRGRLQRLYGKAFRFSLENAEGGGLAATIEIPFEKGPKP